MRCLLLVVALSAVFQGIDTTPTITNASEPILMSSPLKMEGRVAFTEGPAWHPDGNVYFSDIVNNRIMRRDTNGEMHVFRTPSGRTNGIQFDHQGRMLCCEGGGLDSNRRITRTELNGTITVLADRYQDGKFNSPNDLAIDSKGRIYFTDPRYGDRGDMQQRDASDIAIEGVYRIDDVGEVARVIAHEVDRPNGILVSPDDRYLYVADNVNDGPHAQGGNRKLWRFDLNADGSIDPASRKLLFDWGTDRGPDGMAMDTEGRIYAAAGFNFPNPPVETAEKHKAGIYVIAPEGGLLQFIPVPEDMITNCTFGDADRKTLYITAGHKLWSIRTSTPGVTVWGPSQ
ncbi:MAG: SMP-30/gluconolactonase/LRE family protein [Planctomycetaceae bacterium]|nr:SMP-30/gluconolactonase/LRE family protein [Planctomycetaceae bacterium]